MLEMLFSTMDGGVMYHSMDGKRVFGVNRAAPDGGMDAHIAKPIVLDHLEHTLREVFERREAMKG